MRTKRIRWAAAFATAAALGVGLWLIVPSAAGDDPTPDQPAPGPCQLANPQPQEPLELNSTVLKKFVKTVAMEKEVFQCFATPGAIPQTKDVETFIEIVEAVQAHTLKPVSKTVELAECVKDFTKGTVSCRASSVPMLPPTNTPLIECRPGPVQPSDPVEMNTVTVDGFIKTIKVEKEVLNCAGRPADAYLFTEIVEAETHGPPIDTTPPIAPVSKAFEGIICFKDEAKGTVVACRQFTTT